MAGGLIVVLGVAAIALAVNARRHRASTYGIEDPSSAALRIENRTTDFAIARLSIEDAAAGVILEEVRGEIGPGAHHVLELAPGTYVVTVFYVEISMAVMGRPEGTLSASLKASPGKAAILHLSGGRSSPEAIIFVPPELLLK